MTTFTTEDRQRARLKEGSRWSGSSTREEFTVIAVWNPNEELDPWVQYRNQDNKEFTCRLEAFVSRFSPLPE